MCERACGTGTRSTLICLMFIRMGIAGLYRSTVTMARDPVKTMHAAVNRHVAKEMKDHGRPIRTEHIAGWREWVKTCTDVQADPRPPDERGVPLPLEVSDTAMRGGLLDTGSSEDDSSEDEANSTDRQTLVRGYDGKGTISVSTAELGALEKQLAEADLSPEPVQPAAEPAVELPAAAGAGAGGGAAPDPRAQLQSCKEYAVSIFAVVGRGGRGGRGAGDNLEVPTAGWKVRALVSPKPTLCLKSGEAASGLKVEVGTVEVYCRVSRLTSI